MNPAHLHLLVNHLPIFGVFLALPLYAIALWRRDQGVHLSATVLMVFGAVGAFLADNTGEGAEEVVEEMPGISETLIAQHEESAEVAVLVTGLAGVVAIGSFLLARRTASLPPVSIILPAVGAIGAATALAYTGFTGGKIHHEELRDGAASVAAGERGGEAGEEEEEGER